MESAWAWQPRRVVVGVGEELAEQAMWSRRGHGSPVGQSSSSEECSRAGEVESAWAWQPSRLVSAASEEKAIGAHGPVRTGGESVDDGRGLFATAAKCRLTSGTGLLLGGDEGDRDGGKVPVDDGHGLLLGRDEGALTGNICMGSMQVEARCVCRIHGTFSRQRKFFLERKTKEPLRPGNMWKWE